MSGRMKPFLLASIVLNILFAGIFLGHLSHRFLWSHGPHHYSAELLAQLPQDKRDLFENTMQGARHDMEPMRAQLADARKEAARLLVAEPFNEDAYLTQMQHVNDMHAQMKRHMSEVMAKLAKQFSPQERAVLADIVSHSADEPHPEGGH